MKPNAPAALMIAAALAACGGGADEGFDAELRFDRPETAIDYAVALDGAPSEEAEALIRESLDLFRRQEDGAQSLAFLRRRARNDVERIRAILRSFGYYDGGATVAVEGPGARAPAPDGPDDGAEPAAEEEDDAPAALVTVTVEPGPLFTLVRHDFRISVAGDRPAPTFSPAAFGSPVGEGAAAAPILSAERAAAARLRREGRPYARVEGRDAVADLAAEEIEVDSRIAAGPYVTYGELSFVGLTGVEADYLRTYTPWTPGAPIDESQLRGFQRDLAGTNLFDSVSARAPETAPEGDGPAPITVRAEEAEHRSLTAGLRFSTDVGAAARGGFVHRNLFGRNETLDLEAEASFEEQRLTARYRVPQWLRPGQDFTAGGELRNVDNDAFDERAATLQVGVERELTEQATVGLGGLLEVTQTTDAEGEETFYLAGLPGFVDVDASDSELNPTEGWRARLSVTPFAGYGDDGDAPLFTRVQTRASAYLPLDAERRYVLAGRARLGSIIAERVEDVPAPRRFYSGGGGSVRGYAERAIGPRDADGDPSGGLSVAELGLELRALAFDPLGVALFVEGGSVSEDQAPTFSEGVQLAAGGGLRYYSPVGPIRVDVGVPVNPEDDDDAFQIYLSIGQAY